MPAQEHRSDPRILGRRTLEKDHRCLAAALAPGMSVLDVGCGTGAITVGTADVVGPAGRVVGIDRDDALLQIARESQKRPNLSFELRDATSIIYLAEFDVVTASRTLQWITDPGRAIAAMKAAARPGGLLIVLDFNHELNYWEPQPPAEFQRFYRAFLKWRRAHGWDNRVADHLPELMRSCGLHEVQSEVQDEVVRRGEPDFDTQSQLWLNVVESLGEQVAAGGFCTSSDVHSAHSAYAAYIATQLARQILSMRAVTGRA